MLFDYQSINFKLHLKWKSAVTYLIAFVALFSFLGSANQFIVSNTYYSVKNSLDSWDSTPSSISIDDVKIALTKITEVTRKSPDNALYYQLQGQLYEWLHFSESLEDGEQVLQHLARQETALKSAAQSYQKSLSLRPNWSGGWIGLASVKWKLGELDTEFYSFIDEAIRVGPQDAIVHKFIVKFGLKMYVERSVHYAKVFKRLRHHLELGIQNPLSRNFVLEAVRKNNANEPVCRWLGASSHSVNTGLLRCN